MARSHKATFGGKDFTFTADVEALDKIEDAFNGQWSEVLDRVSKFKIKELVKLAAILANTNDEAMSAAVRAEGLQGLLMLAGACSAAFDAALPKKKEGGDQDGTEGSGEIPPSP